MSASPRDTAALSGWMELDYFRRPSPFRSLWTWVTLAALAGSVVLVLFWSFAPGQQTALQAGPVSAAHSMFNNDCRLCHQESFQTLHRAVTLNPSAHAVTDAACLSCHSGPPHHLTQAWNDGCAACHREHRGHMLLAGVEDSYCLACHKDLAKGSVAGVRAQFQNVTGWDNHPAFAARWEGQPNDPGTLKFDHKAHLGDETFTVSKEQLKRVWDDPLADLERGKKRLVCQSCHQPDEAGRYMKPVSFEQHCRECHPIAAQVATNVVGRDQMWAFARQPLPHREPEVVRGAVHERLIDFIKNRVADDEKTKLMGSVDSERPRPIPGTGPRPALVTEAEYEWVNRQTTAIERLMFGKSGQCQFCHTQDANNPTREDGLPRYLPSMVNQRTFTRLKDHPGERVPETFTSPQWFPHSRFSHASHRMVDCAGCHVGIPASTKDDKSAHMPAIESCKQCHGHALTGGVARTDCVECHTYHPAAPGTAGTRLWSFDDKTGLLKRPSAPTPGAAPP